MGLSHARTVRFQAVALDGLEPLISRAGRLSHRLPEKGQGVQRLWKDFTHTSSSSVLHTTLIDEAHDHTGKQKKNTCTLFITTGSRTASFSWSDLTLSAFQLSYSILSQIRRAPEVLIYLFNPPLFPPFARSLLYCQNEVFRVTTRV